MTIPLQKCKGNRLKFQYNNVMALLKSPDQMAKNIDISKNSAGWADQQVALQYQTLDRQLKALTADYQQLLRILNQAGAINGLTDIVKAIRELVQLLQHVDVKNIQMLGNTLKTWILFRGALLSVSAAASSARAMVISLRAATLLSSDAAKVASSSIKMFSGALRAMSIAAGWIGLIITALQLAYTAYDAYKSKEEETAQAERDLVQNTQANAAACKQKADTLTALADQLDAARQKTQDYADAEKNSTGDSEEAIKIKQKILDMLPEESQKKIIAANFSREAINTEIKALNALQVASYQNAVIYAQHQVEKTQALAEEMDRRLQMYATEAQVLASMGDIIGNMQLSGFESIFQGRLNQMKPEIQAEIKTQQEVLSAVQFNAQKASLAIKARVAEAQKTLGTAQQRVKELGSGKVGEITSPNKAPKAGESTSPTGKGHGGSPGGSGGSGSNADDMTAKTERLKWQREQNTLMYDAKVSATEYDTALKKLNNTEDIEGVTAQTSYQKKELYLKRIDDLGTYKNKLEDFKKTLMETLDVKMKENPEIAKQLGYTSDMSDKEKERLLNINKETIQEMKSFVEISKIIGEVDTNIAEADSKLEDVNHTLEKTKLSMKADDVFTRVTDTAKAKYDLVAYHRAGYNDMYEEQKNYTEKIDYLFTVYLATLNKVEAKRKELNDFLAREDEQAAYNAKKALNEALVESEKAESELRQSKLDSTKKIREGMADVTEQLVVEGNSWKDIWSNLWKDFAKEAINAMFRVQGQASLLGNIFRSFGLFGGLGAASAGADAWSSMGGYKSSIPGLSHMGSSVGSYPKMHSGGDVVSPNGVVPQLKNDEVVRTLQVGEEVNSMSERRSNEILGAVAMKAIDSKSQTPTNVNIVAMDSRSFAQYLDDNSDALIAVLAKNEALGRTAQLRMSR